MFVKLTQWGILLTLLLSWSAWAGSGLKSENLRFRWIANDGSFYHHCTHQLIDKELLDWRVDCHQRQFVVHFLVKEIRRQAIPNKTIEVIYYISGHNNSSQGVWINLEKDSPLHSLVFHQSVDNDSSDLVVHYEPSTQ